MNFQKLNNSLTVIANLAVLLGLVALVVEIRANTAAIRSEEWGSISDQALAASNGTNPELNAVYIKALYNLDELSIEELRLYVSHLTARIRVISRGYVSFQNGTVSEEDWRNLVGNVPIFLGTKSGLTIWGKLREDYKSRPEFVSEIERVLEESDLTPDDVWLLDLQSKIRE